MSAWLTVEDFHGKTHIGLAFFEPSEHERKSKVRRIAIGDEDAKLSLDLLTRLYRDQITPPTVARSPKAEKALNAIIGIIKTSEHEGEREAARQAYKKVTGKAWRA